jgi:phosphoglycolate phosphatase-like HAD superfamily hydrolase
MGFFERHRAAATRAPAIRHVVFDPEGLLLDPTPGVRASLDATARDFGLDGRRTLPPDWTPRCSLYSTLATLLGSEDCALIEAAYAGYHRHFAEIGRRSFVRQPGAAALLQLMTARSGCQWHYLSTLGRAAACRLLQDHGLGAAISSIFSSEQPACPGLRPQLLTALLGTLDVDPARVAVLADLPADLYAAQSLGMQGLALDYGRCPPEVLARAPADDHVDSVAAALRWLQARIALRPISWQLPPLFPQATVAARPH